jgi:gluconate 5-dehydrogenase
MNIFDLTGKVAIVTGASSGLGKQFAIVLANYGANVVVAARRVEKLQEVSKEIEALGKQCLVCECDVTNEDSIIKTVNDTVAKFGKVDILVNNAGVAFSGATEDMKLEDWQKVINTNLTGVFLFSKNVIKHMKKNNYGKIINIASIAGFVSFEGMAVSAYCASKGGVVNLTRSLSGELGGNGITVNAIAPGFFPSEMTQAFEKDPTMLKYVESRTSINRWGKDGELNGALLYFASDASSYTTGQILAVDGGWLAE